MLNNNHIEIIKSTIPLLESAGPALTQHFYQRMFSHNPELKDIFNMTHQKTGRQSVALFEAVAAYAKNIENLAALTTAVERIAHKHTSFNIKAEHYQIVGHHLIETLRELAPDAFTKEVEEAWTEAYLFLAQIFIDREEELYQLREKATGGWRGTRRFVVTDKKPESELVMSFVLTPEDGGKVLDYEVGQYLGVQVTPSKGENVEIRQYSLSQAPNGENYRISVKKEGNNSDQLGLVSHYLHDEVEVGAVIEILPPAGDFFYKEVNKPVVLISAGVGCTPMQAMLQQLAKDGKSDPVTYLHACENEQQHSFIDEVDTIVSAKGWNHRVWYREPLNAEGINNSSTGLMDLAQIKDSLPTNFGHFYTCGPVVFMDHVVKQLESIGVERDRIHYEVFGPHANL
ncbi:MULTISPECIES: NO-inducible flavohemoprotein [Vibrio]|uniref:NO-inducible flavohemoprotein n=1 Tax=Vibrio TaxID=662 RepID=UPI00148E1BDD|nr:MULTISPECIES: NO-inducible flavohemoprotein [Vibrio]MCF4174193.1 NO-inducible flavohemoprotein [Vibrio sp. McD22-P3]MCY9854705.1 NO-inducible flavohemoprotein [Vibrio mediterranei]NOH31049.1 NO-inducible flavohemoprotein [Vibrio mediterranei]USE03675.1 NO-inducible flavohemoprotein [Vibrio sp. SCSIO 43133]